MVLRLASLLMLAFLGHRETWLSADEIKPDALIALLPNVATSPNSVNSLRLDGAYGEAKSKLRFRVLFKEPDQFAFLICDSATKTPLCFGSGGKFLLYDPIKPAVIYSDKGGFTLSLKANRDKLIFGQEIMPICSKKSSVSLDLRSLMDYAKDDKAPPLLETKWTEQRRHTLSRASSDGTEFKFGFDLVDKQPCKNLHVFQGRSEVISLSKIGINEPIRKGEFEFPDKKELISKFPLVDLTSDRTNALKINFEIIVTRSTIARGFASVHDLPQILEIPGLGAIDRGVVLANDMQYAEEVRKLVPVSLQLP